MGGRGHGIARGAPHRTEPAPSLLEPYTTPVPQVAEKVLRRPERRLRRRPRPVSRRRGGRGRPESLRVPASPSGTVPANGHGSPGSIVSRGLRGRMGRVLRRAGARSGLVAGQRRGGRPAIGGLSRTRAGGLITRRLAGGRTLVAVSPSYRILSDRGRELATPCVGFVGRTWPRVHFRLPRRLGPDVSRRMGAHLVRQPARLALGSPAFRPDRVLATPGAGPGDVPGLADRLLELRFGRRLLTAGRGYRAQVHGLSRVWTYGVLYEGLRGGPRRTLRMLTRNVRVPAG
jgi:hypothetical protein